MSGKIKNIKAREILDSRGNPTIEVDVFLENGIIASASVASGASTGTCEAVELRDNDKSRYNGKGVLTACKNVNEKIAKVLTGKDITNQKKIDKLMINADGSSSKFVFGANAILGVSLACARAGAIFEKKRLYEYIADIFGFPFRRNLTGKDAKNISKFYFPTPMFNLINGGKHSESGLSIQEFMIMPIGIAGIKEQIRAGSEIFHRLKEIISSSGYSTEVGDEGGFAPKFENCEIAFDFLSQAIQESKYKLGKDIFFAIDAAANSFFDKKTNKYILEPEEIYMDYGKLILLYIKWIEKYPLISIEDGLNEESWNEWMELKQKLVSRNNKFMIVADDLTVTNIKRLNKAVKNECANAVIIKPNQIGTLTETINCIKKAKEAGWKIIISHRSGETTDSFISDLAVASEADFIKAGSLSRGERLAKYNRLMKIEEDLLDIEFAFSKKLM